MGLVLYNPPDSEFLSGGEHRYLPGRPATEGLNPHAKHHRRPLSWSTRKLDDAHLAGVAALFDDNGPRSRSLRQNHPKCNSHLVTLAKTNLRLNRQYGRYCNDPSRITRGHIQRSYRQAYDDNVRGGRELARSGLVLPGEDAGSRGRCRSGSRSRSNSPPSLDRQDAFRDPLTTKKRSYRTALMSAEDVEDQDEELYRMGLLYDDDSERGSGFTLDTIVHDEPVYKVNTRPAKRGRRNGRKEEPKEDWVEFELPLELSYAAISQDPELAAYLKATNEEDTGGPALSPRKRRTESPERDNQPLTVIYELEDDDYSQEDISDEEVLMDGFNNHGNLYGAKENEAEEDDEAWAFINDDNDSNDGTDGCDAAGISMMHQEQDVWVHVHHPSGSDPDPAGSRGDRDEHGS
ncbi:hypothetical protein QBC37DRAFT_298170 [Rhypophila decipiens]|uniref:Uncharacterized protein n=1 Tax=Rhypophila decipiens TaxID=261697 RepID=A0AAN7B4B2_9PEZI|nr:hypothetical protein QBC37DRAFT_298170 [Rhypophila decipiens]